MVADRVDKRRLMVVLQIAMGVQALALGLLTVAGAVRFWEVCLLAVILGLNNAFENSARQAFVREMVGPDELRNAVTLNSVTVNAARAVGPAIGGVLIATVGIGTCFLVNAGSFAAVVASLLVMDRAALRPSPPAGRARGQLREGLRYARRTPTIAIPLAMMSLVGLLAYEFPVSLPVLADRTFHGGAEAYGFMTAAMGIGAVIGGLFTAARGRTGLRPMIIASAGFGVAILVTAVAPVIGLAYVALLFAGWASVSFIAIGNSTIQLSAAPDMRGRVIALWQVAFQGTTPDRRPRGRLDHRPVRRARRPRRRRRGLPGGRRRGAAPGPARRPRGPGPGDGAAAGRGLPGRLTRTRIDAGPGRIAPSGTGPGPVSRCPAGRAAACPAPRP